jgi:ABC-type multidrug transport system ATPase subunit
LAGCDINCQQARGPQPGQRYFCDFGSEFFTGGSYASFFPDGVAQPTLEVDIKAGAFTVRMFHSFCTQGQQLLFEANLSGCETGIKQSCKANGIPTPCFKCEATKKGGSIYVPSDGGLAPGTEVLLNMIVGGGVMFGCKALGGSRMECEVHFDALPFGWGAFDCQSGSQCVNASSGMGMAVNNTGMVNDFGANENLVVYLIIGTLVFFAIVAGLVFAAWKYRFKTTSKPFSVTGVHLAWKGLSVSDLIVDQEGSVDPGAFVAIMGPVGAGKSTLLNCLSGRIEPTDGCITINGVKASAKMLRQTVGFVAQEDICCPEDTVAEAIGFANVMSYAQFPEMPKSLKSKLDARINTLSGGQRRMVCIYVELARQPKALILDEPTTGLDGNSAIEIAEVLTEVAKQIPVLCTIHQPGPEVSAHLSEVIILADGKQVCRAGSFKEGKPAIPALCNLIENSGHMPSEKGLNPLDVALDLAYDGVALGSSSSMKIDDQGTFGAASKRRVPSVPRQLLFMSIRNTKRAIRRKATMLNTAIAAIFIGFSYWQVTDDLGGVRNRFGALFMVHAFISLQTVGATSETASAVSFTEHEIDSFVYLRVVDAIIKIGGQTVGQMVHAVITSVVAYLMVGLRTDGSRPIVFIIAISASFIACSYTALAARARNQSYIGMIRGCALNSAMLLFCGFLLGNNAASLVVWGAELSPLRFSFEIAAAYELIGLATYFDPIGSKPVKVRGSFYLTTYGMVDQMDEEFYALGRKLGTVGAIWMLVAFIVLSLPPQVFTCFRKKKYPSRIKGHGQLEALLSWVSEMVFGEAGSVQNPASTSTSNEADSAVKPDSVTIETGGPEYVNLKQATELCWSNLGNPDTSSLHGGVRTGMFLGIMGPCGSGKTTLLTMLTGRVAPTSGQIQVGSKTVSPQELADMVGYVPQANCLSKDDTLGACLQFAASVGPDTGDDSKTNLKAGGNNTQGVQRIGIMSGGQQRIAAVAVEMVRRPCMLALDEPLSGLDGASSLALTRLLKRISEIIPVVMTVHQPRPELAKLMSHIMVMQFGELRVSLPYPALHDLALKQGKEPDEEKDSSSQPASALDLPPTVVDLDGMIAEESPVRVPRAASKKTALEFLRPKESTNGTPQPDVESTEASDYEGVDMLALFLKQRASAGATDEAALNTLLQQLEIGMEEALTTLSSQVQPYAARHPESATQLGSLAQLWSTKLAALRGNTEANPSAQGTWNQDDRVVDRILAVVDKFKEQPEIEPFQAKGTELPLRKKKSFLKIGRALLGRELFRLWRQRPMRWVGLFTTWFCGGLLIGVSYQELPGGKTTGILQRVGLMFVINACIGVLTLPRIFMFFEVKSKVLHELESKVMHPWLYMACNSLADLTQRVICILIFGGTLLAFIPLSTDPDVQFMFLLTLIVLALAVGYLADAITAMSRDHLSASSLYAAVTIFMMLFGASFISVKPSETEDETSAHVSGINLLRHLSVYLYAYWVLMESELTGMEIEIDVNGISTGKMSGEDWLKTLDVPQKMTSHFLIIIAWAAFFWLLAVFGLMRAIRPRKRSASFR